jgi:hypothetical protein
VRQCDRMEAAVDLQIDAGDQPITEQKRPHVVAVLPFPGGDVDFDPVPEAEKPLRTVACADQRMERCEQGLCPACTQRRDAAARGRPAGSAGEAEGGVSPIGEWLAEGTGTRSLVVPPVLPGGKLDEASVRATASRRKPGGKACSLSFPFGCHTLLLEWPHSTVTLFARFRGLSTSVPFASAA